MAPAAALAGAVVGGTGLVGAGGAAAALTGAGIGSTIGGLVSPGGGFFGGESPQAMTQRVENLTDDQKLLLSYATQQSIKEIKRKRPRFKKKTVVGPSATERRIFKDVRQKILPEISRLPERTRELFEQQVADPARQEFFEETAPRLAARFNAANALSSSAFARQATTQGRELEEGLARQAGQLDFQARQAQLPQYIQALGVGGAERGIQQAQRTGELNQFIANRVAPHPGLANVGNPLGVQSFQNLAFQPQPSPINPLLGALSQNAFSGGFGGMFGGGGGAMGGMGQAAPAFPPMQQQFSSFGLGGVI